MDSSAQPFGLSLQEQAKVKIAFDFHWPLTGAGKHHIEIDGTGRILVVRPGNRKDEAPEPAITGKVKPTQVAALLMLMENEDFLELEPEPGGTSRHPMREEISLTLPSREKTIVADNETASPGFERTAGAIQLLAGMGAADADSPLPFGLKSSELKMVRIFLSNTVKKSGFGKEQLEITGGGGVTLSRSDNSEAPLKSLTGMVPQEHVLTLLSLMKTNGFYGMAEKYSAHSMYESVRSIRLTLPTGEKGVYAEDSKAPREFIRIYGAVKFLAGIGVPECLDRKKYFFFYL
jgi:hypothetical protein